MAPEVISQCSLLLYVLLILSLGSQDVYSRAIPCDGPGITCDLPVSCPGNIELTQNDGTTIM